MKNRILQYPEVTKEKNVSKGVQITHMTSKRIDHTLRKCIVFAGDYSTKYLPGTKWSGMRSSKHSRIVTLRVPMPQVIYCQKASKRAHKRCTSKWSMPSLIAMDDEI